jgi:hypothetical protein
MTLTLGCLLFSVALACGAVAPRAPAVLPETRLMISARYSPGVMERVARKRKLVMGDCGVAMDGPGLGGMIRVEGVRTGQVRTCMVIDVSETRDLKRHQKARQIELDHASARDICGEKHYRHQPKECPVMVTILRNGQ